MRILAKDPTKLSYAIRFCAVYKYVGNFCLILAFLSLVPFIGSIIWKEFSMTFRYFVTFLLFLFLSLGSFRLPYPKTLQDNESFTIISLSFLISSLIMMIPMMDVGLHPMDAWFESVSSVTTTGLSMVHHPLPSKTFFFARSFLQWSGGIGIVIMSLGLAMQPNVANKNLGKSLLGNKDLSTSIRLFAKQMSLFYLALSFVCLAVFALFAPTFYDALIHMLSTVSTGGFSNQPESIASFSIPFQSSIVIFCFLSAVSFPLYYRLKEKDRNESFFSDLQLKVLFILCLILCALLYMLFQGPESLRLNHAFFTGISTQTTTGFSVLPISEESPASKLVLLFSMMIGGCSQSSAGGLKILRFCIFLRSIQMIFLKTSLPKHAVIFDQMGGSRLSSEERESCFALIVLFFSTVCLSWLFFVIAGYPPLDSLVEVVSATSTTGLSTGITSVTLPFHLKVILCIDMFLGRLEFVTFITLFLPRTLIGRRMVS